MNDFKYGDKVYYLVYTVYDYEMNADKIRLEEALITDRNINNQDIRIDTDQGTINLDVLYKSKQECIEAFKRRLDEL